MKYLWNFAVILMLSVVSIDHYLVNDALFEFHAARNDNYEELVQAIQMQDSARRLNTAHNIIMFQNGQIQKLEKQIQFLINVDKEIQIENKQLRQVLDDTAMNLANVINDNAELQTKLDSTATVKPIIYNWFDLILNFLSKEN